MNLEEVRNRVIIINILFYPLLTATKYWSYQFLFFENLEYCPKYEHSYLDSDILSLTWSYAFLHNFLVLVSYSYPDPHTLLICGEICYFLSFGTTFPHSVQFSHSVVSDSLWPHESQHARPPCPSPAPRVYSYSCLSIRWCHPAISSSVVSFSSCPQSLPASGSFPMSQLFAWGGQSIGISAPASVLPMNSQDWSLLGWTCWISLQSKGLSRVFSNFTVQKHQFFSTQVSSQSNHFPKLLCGICQLLLLMNCSAFALKFPAVALLSS